MSDQKMENYLLNVKFCRLIQSHPCIYDRSEQNYLKKDYIYVDSAWAKISREMNDTVASCKERWKNIRTAYARSINIYKTASGPNRRRRYYLHDELQFMTKHLLPRIPSPTESTENHENSQNSIDISSNSFCKSEINEITMEYTLTPSVFQETIQQEEYVPFSEPKPESEPDPEPEQEPVPETDPDYTEPTSQAKKRRRSISEQLPFPQEGNPDSDFLKSLLPEMKIMNSRQKILFKGKIFQALEEVFSDCKDFPQKEEPSVPQTSVPTVRRSLARRFFRKSKPDQREKQPEESPQTKRRRVLPMVQLLPQSHNENQLVKQENETLEEDD